MSMALGEDVGIRTKAHTGSTGSNFRTVGARHWVFGTETGKRLSTGKSELLTLYDIAGTPIRRHRKIKAAANPFDVQWESYFEERLGFAMLDSIKGRVRLIRLWL